MKVTNYLLAVVFGAIYQTTEINAQSASGNFETVRRNAVETLEDEDTQQLQNFLGAIPDLDVNDFNFLSLHLGQRGGSSNAIPNTVACFQFLLDDIKEGLKPGQGAELQRADLLLFPSLSADAITNQNDVQPEFQVSAHLTADSPGVTASNPCSTRSETNTKVIFSTAKPDVAVGGQLREKWIAETVFPVSITEVVREVIDLPEYRFENRITIIVKFSDTNGNPNVGRAVARGTTALLTEMKRVDGEGDGGSGDPDESQSDNSATIFGIAGGAIGFSVLVSFAVYRMNRTPRGTMPQYHPNSSFAAGNTFGPGPQQSVNYNNSNGPFFGKGNSMVGGGSPVPPPPPRKPTTFLWASWCSKHEVWKRQPRRIWRFLQPPWQP